MAAIPLKTGSQKPAAAKAAAPVGAAQARPAQQPAQSVQMPAGGYTPQVDGFTITGELRGSVKEVADALRTISFLEVAPEKEAVNAVYVESRDINKNPYLFSILRIKKDGVEMVYSIPPEIAPRKRRMDVIRYLLNLLTLLEGQYSVDNKAVYQLVEAGVKELSESVTMEYSRLYTSYDSIRKEADDLRKKVERLRNEASALTTKNYDLKAQNDELTLRNRELESISDDTLKAKLQEWITEHNGEINVIEFSRLLKVPEAKVEQMLNRLVAEGYLTVVQ